MWDLWNKSKCFRWSKPVVPNQEMANQKAFLKNHLKSEMLDFIILFKKKNNLV